MEIDWKKVFLMLLAILVVGFCINVWLDKSQQEISTIMYWTMVGIWQTLAAIYLSRKQNT